MLKMADFRVVLKHNLLLLDPDESAILIRGNMYLFSHKEDVKIPSLQAVFSPGDIMGNSAIDNGWTREVHSWIITYAQCDILVIKTKYLDYMWEKMKNSSLAKPLASRLRESPCFSTMSEQSIYTLVFDMLNFKKTKKGEMICS